MLRTGYGPTAWIGIQIVPGCLWMVFVDDFGWKMLKEQFYDYLSVLCQNCL